MENKTPPAHSLYLEIYNNIKHDILKGTYPQGSMLPTEKELADVHYVSRITIRKAMQLLKEEGFISRVAGRGTFVEKLEVKTYHKLIGVVLCNMAYSFGLGILTSIERTAAKLGYHIVFKNSLDSHTEETKDINDLIALGVEGIIIQPVHNEYYNETLIQHHFNNFPIVLVDRSFNGFSIPSVSTNSFEMSFTATNYLFDRNYENIAFITSPYEHTSTLEDRVNGFTSAHFARKQLVDEHKLLNTVMSPQIGNSPENLNDDLQKIKKFLTEAPQLDALIASEFTVAKLIYKAIKELNKKIPDDYALIMYDAFESITDLSVTHILQDQEQLGSLAFEALIDKINGNRVSNKIYAPFSIIDGDTTPPKTK